MQLGSRAALVGALALSLVAGSMAPAFARSPLPGAHRALARRSVVSPVAPLRIVSAVNPQLDAGGATWQPDAAYASGGALKATSENIARTGSDVLYRHERVGVHDYTIPVSTPATYFVDLFTSETPGVLPGQRVWNVSAEGQRKATVDVARDAGTDTAYHVLFAVPVTDGTLNLHITPLVGQPVVAAVEVDYEKATTRPAALFDDEFDGAAGTSPSSANWGFAEGGNGWGNNELESYTSRPSNASLDGAGDLSITARQENYTGWDGINRNYTSARLNTRDTFTYQYGTATARIKLPSGGPGLWPAFWALGSNSSSLAWPLCGEMDILENTSSQPNTAYATVHAAMRADLTAQWLSGTSMTTAQPLSDSYHTFGLVWGPNAMSMSLDGQTYFSLSSADMAGTTLWNFNHPFFLLLDLAVGGTWSGYPTADTVFPATMSVDYVRVTG